MVLNAKGARNVRLQRPYDVLLKKIAVYVHLWQGRVTIWKRIYNKRISVERVNSRIDVLLGCEKHTIRGMKKMTMRLLLSLCIRKAMAKGRVKQNQTKELRRFYRAV
jgi:hypothetical protein